MRIGVDAVSQQWVQQFHHDGRHSGPRPLACHSGTVKMAACSTMSEWEKGRDAHYSELRHGRLAHNLPCTLK